MKVAIFGAGAIGGLLGVKLVQAGAEVTFIARGPHLDAMRKDGITLVSDGATVYACTSRDEIVDLLQGGQGVFGIALGRIWQDVEGSLANFPADNQPADALPAETGPAGAETPSQAVDELAPRRAKKTS